MRPPAPTPATLLAFALSSLPAVAAAAPPANHTRDDATSRRERPWIRRWAPERNTGELGAFAGVFVASRSLELFAPRSDRSADGFRPWGSAGAAFGVRGGFYPSRFFGVELEGQLSPQRLVTPRGRALLWAARGQLVAQLGLWSVTPFVAAGTGALAVASKPAAVGHDVDWALHVGGGLKIFAGRRVGVRVDVRDVISNGVGIGAPVANSIEATVGLSIVLGRARDRRARPVAVAPIAAPPLDSDGDGLFDHDDGCPREPETRNDHLDDDGCPDALPVAAARFGGVIEGIAFALDSADISADSEAIIAAAADVLAAHPELRVRIVGHTDDAGTPGYNLALSRRRASAVARALVARGVEASRLETTGAGDTQPRAPNDDAQGRARNRRIEFQILEPEATP